METTRTHTPVLPYESGCKHASPCANVYAGRACALDATKANGYDAEGRATVTYLEDDEEHGAAAGSIVYALDPYTGRPSGRKYDEADPEAPTAAGQLVRRVRDGVLDITTDAPRARTPQIAVQWVGGNYPVLMQLDEVEREERAPKPKPAPVEVGPTHAEIVRRSFRIEQSTHPITQCERCAEMADRAVTNAMVTGSTGATYGVESGSNAERHMVTVKRPHPVPGL